MLKKIMACLLIAASALLCFAGCTDDGVPDDMYSASIAGEPFILYVPDGWTDNRDSGISSAYYSLNDVVTVSARYYTPVVPEGEAFSLDAYIDQAEADYTALYQQLSRVERSAAKLGDNNATRCRYTFDRTVKTQEGEKTANVTLIQYYTFYKGDVVILNFYCLTDAYKSKTEYSEMFEQIRSEFVLCDKTAVNNEITTDKKTPEGMKIASYKTREYVFYVPTTWVSDYTDQLTYAYYPESGKPNITVTSYSPDDVITARDYFAYCESTYQKEIAGYNRISETEGKVFGFEAWSYVYSAVYGQAEYRIMQTVFEYNDMIYSITYTALADSYDKHLDDVNAMIGALRFR